MAICRKDHIHICINKKDENYVLKPINSTRKVTLLNLAETISCATEHELCHIKSGCQRKPGKMLKMSTEGGRQNKFILTS